MTPYILIYWRIILIKTQPTFQPCFDVAFWLIWHRDVGQCQINVEVTLCISKLKFTTSNNVESTLCISMLMWTTLDNVQTTLSFSASSFTRLVNVETTLGKWSFPRRTKKNHFKWMHWIQLPFYNLHFTPHFKRNLLENTCKAVKIKIIKNTALQELYLSCFTM